MSIFSDPCPYHLNRYGTYRQCCGAGLFSWSRSQWKWAGSSSGLLLCDIPTVGFLRWQSCDNSYNFSQIITIVAQMKRKNRYGTPLEKSNTIFLYFSKLLTNFFFPEPAAWPGASQDWIGSPTLGTGNFGKKIRRYFFHHCLKKIYLLKKPHNSLGGIFHVLVPQV